MHSGLRIALAGALGLGLFTLAAAPASAERYRVNQLHPDLRAIVAAALRERGIAPASASVAVTVDNCPPFCNAEVRGGICYCPLNDAGGCTEPLEEGELRGQPMCKIVPTRVEVGTTTGDGTVGSVTTLEILAP